jgi:hypothetical protein
MARPFQMISYHIPINSTYSYLFRPLAFNLSSDEGQTRSTYQIFTLNNIFKRAFNTPAFELLGKGSLIKLNQYFIKDSLRFKKKFLSEFLRHYQKLFYNRFLKMLDNDVNFSESRRVFRFNPVGPRI